MTWTTGPHTNLVGSLLALIDELRGEALVYDQQAAAVRSDVNAAALAAHGTARRNLADRLTVLLKMPVPQREGAEAAEREVARLRSGLEAAVLGWIGATNSLTDLLEGGTLTSGELIASARARRDALRDVANLLAALLVPAQEGS
ncbi:hypothetical protein DAETH_48640 (plasmid) [Deinococcus aetherius]|uniref:DUF2383 domain-containing protein n=1 Tax=Deinococcus aetherius TaxID=200252 RepID=A0ABM8AM46_9DEIO|nr:hypothetical protein [Deinococcus aetherius]BDP44895.1 hypothetical protein DAETH_48640 [Deinococcus aetherius]